MINVKIVRNWEMFDLVGPNSIFGSPLFYDFTHALPKLANNVCMNRSRMSYICIEKFEDDHNSIHMYMSVKRNPMNTQSNHEWNTKNQFKLKGCIEKIQNCWKRLRTIYITFLLLNIISSTFVHCRRHISIHCSLYNSCVNILTVIIITYQYLTNTSSK